MTVWAQQSIIFLKILGKSLLTDVPVSIVKAMSKTADTDVWSKTT